MIIVIFQMPFDLLLKRFSNSYLLSFLFVFLALYLRLNNYNDVGLWGDEYLTFWTKSKHSLSSSTYQKILDGFRVYHKYMNFNFFKSLYFLFCLSMNFILKK